MKWRMLIPVAMIFAVVYVCLFAGGNSLGLLGPDEPRYVAIAREMAETGDWVTPRLQGTPWFEKPILLYWAVGACFKLFGPSEAVARIPSGLATVLAALMLGWLAYRMTSRGSGEAAFLTALIVPSTVGAVGFGRAATTDMLFSGLLAGALVCAAEIVWQPLRGRRKLGWEVAWGVALGLAALAKGPAAILLAGGSVALWVIATRRFADAFRLVNVVSLVAFAFVALPWYVLCAMRNPDFFRVFFISHNFERFLTPVFQHVQPFWFFAPVLLLGLVPWAALLALGAREIAEMLRLRRWAESQGLFVLCWALFPLIFFSISKSKLPGYILPALLPLAMLCGRALARVTVENEALACRIVAAVGVTFLAIAVSGGTWQNKLPADAIARLGEASVATRMMVTLGASGIGIAWLALRRRLWVSLLLCSVVTCGLVLTLLKVGERLDPDLSARATAAAILQWKPDAQKVRVHHIHRAWHYGLNYYLHVEIPGWNETTPQDNLLVVSDEGLLDLLSRGFDVRVAQRVNKRAILVFAEKPQR